MLAILLATGTAHAQSVPRIAMYASAMTDLHSTWAGMQRGYRESNPLLGTGKVRQTGTVMGLTALADVAASRIARNGHPHIATATRLTIGAFHFGCAAHNWRMR